MDNRKRRFRNTIIFLLILILLGAAFPLRDAVKEGKIRLPFWDTDQKEDIRPDLDKIYTAIKAALYATSHKKSDVVKMSDVEAEPKENNTQKETMPLTEQEVYPSDIYSESGIMAEFQCYVPSAISYTWEYYDTSAMQWIPAEETAISERPDELYRVSSFYNIEAVPENNERMIRCTIGFEDQDPVVKLANLYIISKEIVNIAVDDAEYPAGSYLSTEDIPITVVYSSGNRETFTGLLNGMYFVDRQESKEFADGVSGNRTETVTTIYTEHKYLHLGVEEKEILMRYRIKDSVIEKKAVISGKDNEPPDITEISLSDYDISTVDKAIPITVSISAYDNDTPQQQLLYAFLPEGQEVTEEDWKTTASFDMEITQNGTWTAYCKDQSGNIRTEEKRIITVDEKAPVISELRLEKDTWCRKNAIIVTAADELEIFYRYCLPETGEDSGWISESIYEISDNGTWEIQVKDAVGNISEIKELLVSNIDTQAPVIISITEGD